MAFAIAAVVTAVVGAAVNIKQANDAKQAAEKQETLGENVALSQRLTAQKRNVRARRIALGRLKQSARNTGTADSSGEAGAAGSISTQFASAEGGANFATAVGVEKSSIASELRDKTQFNQQIGAVNSVVSTGAQVELATESDAGGDGAISTMFS